MRRVELPVRVVAVGLGGIGQALVDAVQAAPDLELVAAVDPVYAGATKGEVVVIDRLSDFEDSNADVAVVATGSSLTSIQDEVREALAMGLDVVSTCEELAYPWKRHAKLAEELHEVAVKHEGRVLGCGVNPGFVMDVLPVVLASASLDVVEVAVERSVNLRRRRPQLREKMGVGLSEEDWEARARRGEFGHQGLIESAYLLADAIALDVDREDFSREPITDDQAVAGIRETAVLDDGQGRGVSLVLVFAEGAVDRDSIIINGTPKTELVIENGVHGDQATVARALHAARVVASMPPGLRVPTEMPASIRR